MAPTSLYQLIDWRRGHLDLSQGQVATAAGTTQATVSRVERGSDVRVSTLVEIARALDMDVRIVPRELLATIDDLINSLRAADINTPADNRPLYTLDDSDDDTE